MHQLNAWLKNKKVSLSFGRRQVGVTALQVLWLSVAISEAWMSVEKAFQAAEIQLQQHRAQQGDFTQILKIPQLFCFTLPNSMIRHTGFHTTRTRWMLLPRRPGLIASVNTEDSCGRTLQKNSKGEFDIYLQMKRTDKHSGK